MGWVGSSKNFRALGWVQKFLVGLAFKKSDTCPTLAAISLTMVEATYRKRDVAGVKLYHTWAARGHYHRRRGIKSSQGPWRITLKVNQGHWK